MTETCECCGQDLPEPTEEDKPYMWLGSMLQGLILADLIRQRPQ